VAARPARQVGRARRSKTRLSAKEQRNGSNWARDGRVNKNKMEKPNRKALVEQLEGVLGGRIIAKTSNNVGQSGNSEKERHGTSLFTSSAVGKKHRGTDTRSTEDEKPAGDASPGKGLRKKKSGGGAQTVT